MNSQPDDAIRVLEQAVNLNPANGQNYYYLAEAWLMKGNMTQAREFNRLAALTVEKKAEWTVRVLEQQERINTIFR